MWVRFTKYGLPQVVVFPALTAAVMVGYFIAAMRAFGGFGAVVWGPELVLLVILVWILSFFRDPYRQVPAGNDILLSPADGVVKDIEVIDEDAPGGDRTLRIGIFLSVFNVHVNRVPCAVRIDEVTYKKGQFKNAMDPQAGRVNESNSIAMTRLDEPWDRLLVRQISGAIARRIVCYTPLGKEFAGGEKFGMIKFGSRTELYVPMRPDVNCIVKVGDKVKAGMSVVVRYEKCQKK